MLNFNTNSVKSITKPFFIHIIPLLIPLFVIGLAGCYTSRSTFALKFDRTLDFSSSCRNKRQSLEIVIPDTIPPSPEFNNNIEDFRAFLVDTFRNEAKRHFDFVSVVNQPTNKNVPRIEVVSGSGFLDIKRLSTNFDIVLRISDSAGNSYPLRKLEVKGRGLPVTSEFEAILALHTAAVSQPMTVAADELIRSFRDKALYADCLVQETKLAKKSTVKSTSQIPVAASIDSKDIDNKINRRWALVIGISKYKSSGINPLSYADADAEAFHDQLKEFGWLKSRTRLLTNAEATKQNIEIALESWLSEASPNDLILLFWAGHGMPDPANMEHVYFACYDTIPSIPATGYRMDRVVESLKERGARNVVVLADTCHAGKLSTRGSRGIRVNPYVDGLKKKKQLANGWIFMTGASTEQEAVEHPAWSNGVFTYCLLNGLRGKADGAGGALDGIVTMGELKDYLQETMPKETKRVLGVAKFPQIVTTTGDTNIWNLTLKE
ncbi:MAG: caspase family protein [Proteobacteria bacterium]|nr:caspase family protein [Pseudomonadota bacterium]